MFEVSIGGATAESPSTALARSECVEPRRSPLTEWDNLRWWDIGYIYSIGLDIDVYIIIYIYIINYI